MPSIVDFFEVYNIDHIAAYKNLMDTGKWPEGFVPEGTASDPMWQVEIANKMAHAWVEQAMSGRVYGIPEYLPN